MMTITDYQITALRHAVQSEMLKAENLSKVHLEAKEAVSNMEMAEYYAEKVLPAMTEARAVADQIEVLLSEKYKPFPSYEDLLFSI